MTKQFKFKTTAEDLKRWRTAAASQGYIYLSVFIRQAIEEKAVNTQDVLDRAEQGHRERLQHAEYLDFLSEMYDSCTSSEQEMLGIYPGEEDEY